uniref:Uncharacterized protein n=1 Tax=Arundo donax TaxID=35708 RepID=A0A0A9GZG9_ARUDO
MAPPHCQRWAHQGSQQSAFSGCGETLAAASAHPEIVFLTRTSSRLLEITTPNLATLGATI